MPILKTQESARGEQNCWGELSNSIGRELLFMEGRKALFGSI